MDANGYGGCVNSRDDTSRVQFAGLRLMFLGFAVRWFSGRFLRRFPGFLLTLYGNLVGYVRAGGVVIGDVDLVAGFDVCERGGFVVADMDLGVGIDREGRADGDGLVLGLGRNHRQQCHSGDEGY